MLSRMSARELNEWMIYARLEPFGELRADLRSGIVASTIANVNRGRNTKAAKISEFMPDFRTASEKQADVASQIRDVFARLPK